MCESCRSQKMLKNDYLDAKIGVDTAENEHSKVWPTEQCSTELQVGPVLTGAGAADPVISDRVRQWRQLHFSQLEKLAKGRGQS